MTDQPGTGAIGSVQQLWRYPVKSMGGDRIPKTEVTEAWGIPGDRAWAVRDEEAGQIRSAKQLHPLMQVRARYLAEPVAGSAPPVQLTLPDGSVATSEDSDVHERLSEALGKRVSLWPRQPAGNLDHYRKSRPISERDLREMLDVDEGDELPDFSGSFTPFSEEVIAQLGEYATPPGTYFDMMPLSLLTTASLRTLTEMLPDSVIDPRRFRKNLIVDTPDLAGFPEQEWVGRELRIGSVRALVTGPVSRCVMVTLPQEELERDRAVLKTLARQARTNFGIYLRVLEPGRIQEGDAVGFA
ncbi:MOSC domain-containing protein [Enemella sp. A6]|uniref:MOSC domain-containing protein n=1 Tax=Enemella sp. A6 TaxID=3440152 RepID=UPI003EBADD3A